MLPEAVLLRAQAELLDWQGTGKSVMEISHRSNEFGSIADHAESTLRQLLSVPDDYRILFLSGGATQQFSVIPMNLMQGKSSADYMHTGIWSEKAMQLAKRYTQVKCVCSSESSKFTTIPAANDWLLDPDAAYVYYTDNETIGGLEFHSIPDVGQVPLVTDMTSSILSKQIDVSRFGIIFAAAQKNIGPAGMTLVIIHETLLGEPLPFTPDLFNYQLQVKEKSLLNTPPTFNWYMAGLMFDWIKEQGGIEVMHQRNKTKAAMLYKFIDTSNLYQNNIDTLYRSNTNVVFTLEDESLNEEFLKQARAAELHDLKGHRLAGGMRASLYNAMPETGVKRLVEFMQEFEQTRS